MGTRPPTYEERANRYIDALSKDLNGWAGGWLWDLTPETILRAYAGFAISKYDINWRWQHCSHPAPMLNIISLLDWREAALIASDLVRLLPAGSSGLQASISDYLNAIKSHADGEIDKATLESHAVSSKGLKGDPKRVVNMAQSIASYVSAVKSGAAPHTLDLSKIADDAIKVLRTTKYAWARSDVCNTIRKHPTPTEEDLMNLMIGFLGNKS